MSFFFHRVFSYRPHKPRNPWLKLLLGVVGVLLLGVVGVLLLGVLVVFGLVIGLGMLLFAAARRVLRAQGVEKPVASPEVIEGEFAVVRDTAPRLTVR